MLEYSKLLDISFLSKIKKISKFLKENIFLKTHSDAQFQHRTQENCWMKARTAMRRLPTATCDSLLHSCSSILIHSITSSLTHLTSALFLVCENCEMTRFGLKLKLFSLQILRKVDLMQFLSKHQVMSANLFLENNPLFFSIKINSSRDWVNSKWMVGELFKL